MMPAPSASDLPAELERILERFDIAWRSGKTPAIEDYLRMAGGGSSRRRQLLSELVKIDVEYRWRAPARTAGAAERPRLEDYVKRYPDLGPLHELPADLIGEEYRVRRRAGERPSHAEYTGRFDRQGKALQSLLAQIDRDLADEAGRAGGMLPPAERQPPDPRDAATPPASSTALLQALRDSAVLRSDQLEELTRLPAATAEARVLAKELLHKGWLTPYQVNQLLQGRGRDLLVGPYLLLERLGEGGAGQVFKVRHEKMNRILALKVIRKELLADPEIVGRFYREIRIAGQLDHPNVVHAYDAGPAGSSHFLAMEYVEGTDLGRLVKQGGPLPALQACEYIRQAALGLQHAHERGLVHRDIKPHNLIMSIRDGLIKVADLGLARLPRAGNDEVTAALTGASATAALTPQHAVMMGTADYLAPEQALDFHNADIRADIYSLGCTLYYLLAGRPPFPGATLTEKLLKHQQAEPPPIENAKTPVPQALIAVLHRMLAKKPKDRYQTPAEVVEALAPLLHHPGRDWISPALRQRKRRRMLLAAAGFLLLILGLTLLLLRRDRESQASDEFSRRFPEAVNVLSEQQWQVLSVAVTADAHWLAFAGEGDGAIIQLWDLRLRKHVLNLRGHQGPVVSLAFSPDGLNLASAGKTSANLSIHLWDLSVPRKPIRSWEGRSSQGCRNLLFSPDGKWLAVNDWGKLHWFDLATGSDSWPEGPGGVNALTFSSNGTLAASLQTGGVLLLMANFPKGKSTYLPDIGTFSAIAFAPDGKTLACCQKATTELRNAETGDLLGRLEQPDAAATVVALAFARDGTALATLGNKGLVVVWDTKTRNKVWQHQLEGTQPCVPGCLIFASDRYLVTARDRTIYVLAPPRAADK
jgi:serine/threonine protein kinase